MSKIKLNLVSGVSIEKPLINAFIGNSNRYVVLDNEMNGSMGLPIILVCKLIDNKLVKIVDQNEWTQVKEYLKQIIAGNKLESIQVANNINADDVYYTQLTLPVPSFEALKNAYEGSSSNGVQVVETPQVEVAPISVEPVMPEAPVPPSMPEVNVAPSVEAVVPMMESVGITPEVNASPVNEPVMPTAEVTPTPVGPVMPSTPVPPSMPEVNVAPVIPEPVMPEAPQITPEPVVPVMPSMPEVPTPEIQAPVMESTNIEPGVPVTPTISVNEPVMPQVPGVVESTPEVGITTEVTENIFAAQKEAFLQACENMFDALVQKFEKELENKSDK